MSLESNNKVSQQNTEEHHFKATKSFRYVCSGDPEKARTLIYVLHGYGQLAKFFIRKFNLLTDNYFVVAPEGMHRYYLQGTSGRVGASWMTKEDREIDISDNLNWLNQLDLVIRDKGNFERVIILGFSQGGATAARWYYHGMVKADNLIMWATVFPPDLFIELETKSTKNDRNYFVLGTMDEYYDDKAQEEINQFYEDKGFHSIRHNGKHDIENTTLTTLLNMINSFHSE
jgi:predicted esterase